MDTAKIEAFLRDLHELCKKHDASLFGEDGGVFSARVGGSEFMHISADSESAMVDTEAHDSHGVCFEHDGEIFTRNGVKSKP